MRRRIRLKTKLVLAISAMVVALVAALSSIYVSRIVAQRVEEAQKSGEFVGRQIFHAARQALDLDLSSTRVDLTDPQAMERAIAEILQTDPGLNSLLQSIVGYSPIVYDAAITDMQGRVLAHTDATMLDQVLPQRPGFEAVHTGGARRQIAVVFGRPAVYEIRLPLEREGAPFGAIRVGISTVFLKNTLQPQLESAIFFSGLAVLISLVLAAGLSNFALRPLEAISRRLDQMTGEAAAAGEPEPRATDEYGVVNTKIDRLGRQMRDVKEVFTALKENLDQMMANLQDGVLLFTRDSKAVLVSASAEKFLGKPRGQMLGRQLTDIFAPDSPLGRVILDAFRWRQPLDDREVEREDGRRLHVSLDFIEEHGERIGALITMRDAESVRRIEDEIELSRRLSALGRLTSGVAHEVRNPINAIVVHLEVLKQKLREVEPDTRRHMDVISSEIQRLDRVVQTLIDFTRPVELRLAEMDLAQLVDEVALLAGPEAEGTGVVIERDTPEPLPVRADADLVKQALLNVVLNGVQAMPGGGTLRLSALRNQQDAVIEVEDHGSGIPAAIRDKIFNLYFSTKPQGSGIGLPMSYRVLQLHNGSLEFDSVEGRGTTFRLRLPLAEKSQTVASEAAVPGVS